MKVSILNRSQWPDWWVNPICQWVAHRAGIYKLSSASYELVIANVQRKTMLAGRSWGYRARVRINRRFQPVKGFPYTTRYWRYAWSFKYELMNRLEAFVDIVSHEMFHSTGGRRSLFTKGGKTDVAAMEMACERFSKETVEAFRKEWPTTLRARVKQAARAKAQPKAKPSKVEQNLKKANEYLAKWQKKSKLADTKVAKYKKMVKRYETKLAQEK